MPMYSKARGAQFSTGPSRTFMAGSRTVFRGPGRTSMRGPNPSPARSITRNVQSVGVGPRRTPSAEGILRAWARGISANEGIEG